MVNELIDVQREIKEWQVVVLALGYHDIVYNVFADDNEEASAEYARKALDNLISGDQIIKCNELILATKSHDLSDDTDANYFTDADLSILGKGEFIYQEYASKIRKEYFQVPDFLYKEGRAKVLKNLLAMPRIFKTSHFFEQYENNARINLAQEIKELQQ
jgi:predicted metal-dependent HD superfamily phosphohydrolase